ncbi:MAG: hypothetical protein JXX14_07690 [Deltaproteobacteria bacterium]|nr:hypothetical protein [Deltaproteobacteria bacterium]
MDIFEILSQIHWRPKVGDPYPLAWATVFTYMLASVACALCAVRARHIFGNKDLKTHRFIWWFISTILLFLAVNKQLDLQTLFTQVMKLLAKHWDIYELGKRSQKYFLLGMGIISLGGLIWILWRIRKTWRKYVILMLGALMIVRFVLVRAGTFYGVGMPKLSVFTGGLKLNWLIEILGALTLATAAIVNIATGRRKQRKNE